MYLEFAFQVQEKSHIEEVPSVHLSARFNSKPANVERQVKILPGEL
jgi:hypothetical protein